MCVCVCVNKYSMTVMITNQITAPIGPMASIIQTAQLWCEVIVLWAQSANSFRYMLYVSQWEIAIYYLVKQKSYICLTCTHFILRFVRTPTCFDYIAVGHFAGVTYIVLCTVSIWVKIERVSRNHSSTILTIWKHDHFPQYDSKGNPVS